MNAWDELLAEIRAKRDELECTDSGAWFRGVDSSDYDLKPKLFRRERKALAERNIYLSYLRTSMARRDGATSSWVHLVNMQHGGVHTRMLDWTESFAVAMYFALRKPDETSRTSPCIWILNPFTLATRTRGENDKSMGDFHLDGQFDYYAHFCQAGESTWPHRYPMPFYSPAPNDRIVAQQGFFTVHGTDPRPLDKTCQRHVRKVVVPDDAIEGCKSFLELAEVRHETMFPDMEGWLSHVEATYFYTGDEETGS